MIQNKYFNQIIITIPTTSIQNNKYQEQKTRMKQRMNTIGIKE